MEGPAVADMNVANFFIISVGCVRVNVSPSSYIMHICDIYIFHNNC